MIGLGKALRMDIGDIELAFGDRLSGKESEHALDIYYKRVKSTWLYE